jgi:hypothetical protein
MEKIVKFGTGTYASVETTQVAGMIKDQIAWDPTVTKQFVRFKKAWQGNGKTYSPDRIEGFDTTKAPQVTQMNQLIADGIAEPWPKQK